eukprot:TRINITY_DN1230_c0_g1_i1.p1 TRINITY_DN1230_c0_g1~~TRINITY_DN1230_c0_g1_i1.p1  ORF type:complete len:229 (+),score=23.76 TRINITY_DN1230_c0_g1_i1:114-800(+)
MPSARRGHAFGASGPSAAAGGAVSMPLCDHEETPPPCAHNHWSDLRTRKDMKMLLCHVCLAKWKLCACRCGRNSCPTWSKRGTCNAGVGCRKLHVGHSRPRVQPGSGPAAASSLRDAPLAPSFSPLSASGPAPVVLPQPPPYPPSSVSTPLVFAPSNAPFASTPSMPPPAPGAAPAAGEGLQAVTAWAAPAVVSACGEYLEECADHEPEGVAMTEEQLDAHLRSIGLA